MAFTPQWSSATTHCFSSEYYRVLIATPLSSPDSRGMEGWVGLRTMVVFESKTGVVWILSKNHYTRFPVNFHVDGEAAKSCCYGLVTDLLATRPTSPQQVAVVEFGKQHDTTDTTEYFCPQQLVTDLLRGNWILALTPCFWYQFLMRRNLGGLARASASRYSLAVHDFILCDVRR